MSQLDKARHFEQLHVKGTPLLLYNAWDAGSARAVLGAGAKAIATSSWAVAAAHGYDDGEAIPIALAQEVLGRIVGAVELPVTVDFEGGYADDDVVLAENVARLLELGVVGINFEDRVVRGEGLYAVERQARRIAAIRATAKHAQVPLFINARTDLFLGRGTPNAVDTIARAIERASAYAAAGASGFFVPGLTDEASIGTLCERVDLPVNVMVTEGMPSLERLRGLGVARVSWGNTPYVTAMATLTRTATTVLA
jgi:2-methylisocitrate lyase-like PEP mutase family enzyme